MPIGGGVWLSPAIADPVWRALREAVERRRADGGRVRPEIAEALDVLRAAAFSHLTDANGHESRTSADIDPRSALTCPVPTSALADRLGVSPRHARRLARAEGIEPVTRNAWAREDVEALVARRS
ncbi:hypothetical protein [Actinoplanes solisilvae]|uniref:hypothetical protein n=1 Tax=Actinoplanes solisilvae TaxID=2486853 RepID=UPI000FDC4E0E|nr:hypothetical protein [Actinoplanes solisilvae]